MWRCVVYSIAPADAHNNRIGLLSKAYGEMPQRTTCEDAYKDLVALKATSMKTNHFGSTFFPMVVEYIKGAGPPQSMAQHLYFKIDGDG